jgi:hypothetical protein
VLAIEPLALFCEDVSKSDYVKRFFSRLFELDLLTGVYDGTLFIHEESIAALCDSGRYPVGHHFDNYLASVGMEDVYASHDIIKVFNSIIDKSVVDYSIWNIEDVIFEGSVVDGVDQSQIDSYFISPEENFYSLLACNEGNILNIRRNVLPYVVWDKETIDVETNVICVVPEHAVSCSIDEPLRVNAGFPVIGLNASFADVADVASIWQWAEAASDLHIAIRLGAYRLLKVEIPGIELHDVPRFVIGSEFYDSLGRNQGLGTAPFAQLCLECSARVIAGMPKSPLEPFRVAAGSGSAARKRARDGAVAKRTHLTTRAFSDHCRSYPAAAK